jgi:hypothetical protein
VTQGYSAVSALTSDGPLSSQPIPPHDSHYHDQAQFESDKRAVYKYVVIIIYISTTKYNFHCKQIGILFSHCWQFYLRNAK